MAGGGTTPPLPPAARARRVSVSLCRWARPFFLILASLALAACASSSPLPRESAPAVAADSQRLLADLEERTFRFFWETARPETGLVPDRWPTPSFSSIAAVGFALTAYPIGVERGYVTRDQAAQRTLRTLRFFAAAPEGPEPASRTAYHGFYYHFLDLQTGLRFERVELSTVDTALLLAGALTGQAYFDRPDPLEKEIRALAETLYRRADWRWIQPRPPLVAMGWTPEQGFHAWDWRGYNEALILYVLALGSPTHPIEPAAWAAYTSSYRFADFYGQAHLAFPPLFGHEYSPTWIDLRGVRDAFMRQHGLDYFENSRRAALAQRAYAIANPGGFRDYGPEIWGLSACDGPADTDVEVDGRRRHFQTYAPRGAAATQVLDDGTLAPYAVVAALPFVPAEALAALAAMRRRYGDELYGRYGFLDAFNPTLTIPIPLHHGRVVPGVGWFDTDYLGIDQGVALAMLENYRSGFVWRLLRGNSHVRRGLARAGFSGGWLGD